MIKITEIEKKKISNNPREPLAYLRTLVKRIVCAHWCKDIKAMSTLLLVKRRGYHEVILWYGNISAALLANHNGACAML